MLVWISICKENHALRAWCEITWRVVSIAISDHYLILTIRKINIHLNQIRSKKIEIRNFKHFNTEGFLND